MSKIFNCFTNAIIVEDENLSFVDLCVKFKANLYRANLYRANLKEANLKEANLYRANLEEANLYRANLKEANLEGANLYRANLYRANLEGANLEGANLEGANLEGANLEGANLEGANLEGANLEEAKGLIKLMGVEPGNTYWKCIGENLINENFQYVFGLNILREGEIFASDEQVLCSYPGFHFSSKSWALQNYGERKYLVKLQIPTLEQYPNVRINEPWATDGKSSSNAVIILQIFETKTMTDVTDKFKK